MAEMRRPMDFWKGWVRPCYLRSKKLIKLINNIHFKGNSTNSHLHCLSTLWVLYLRMSGTISCQKVVNWNRLRHFKGNLPYPWHTRV